MLSDGIRKSLLVWVIFWKTFCYQLVWEKIKNAFIKLFIYFNFVKSIKSGNSRLEFPLRKREHVINFWEGARGHFYVKDWRQPLIYLLGLNSALRFLKTSANFYFNLDGIKFFKYFVILKLQMWNMTHTQLWEVNRGQKFRWKITKRSNFDLDLN